MFHIVLNSSEEYIKYAAVLINSIIKNTDETKSFKDFCKSEGKISSSLDDEKIDFNALGEDERAEGYVFHILSDFVSDASQAKLQKLQSELSAHYPCQIQIHILNNNSFKGLPGWGENASFLTYYRILAGEVLAKNLKRCLCLDVDMLALCDVRELFGLDLKGKIIGAVCDFAYQSTRSAHPKVEGLKPFKFDKDYFNAGFMLIDLNLWRKAKITQRAIEYFKEYHSNFADQDALNCVLQGKTFKLSFAYDCLTPIYTNVWGNNPCEDEFDDKISTPSMGLYYTQKAFKQAKEEPKILHYTIPKPWFNIVALDYGYQNYTPLMLKNNSIIKKWWHFALSTPAFDDELKALQSELKEKELLDYATTLSSKLMQRDNEVKHLKKQLLTLIDPKLESAVVRIKNQLSYRLGKAIVVNSKNFKGYLKMPFALLNAFLIYKKKQRVYKARISYNPNLKLPPLETYADFKEALKVKSHLSYKLGKAFLKGLKTSYKGGLIKFYFEAKRLERGFKNKKY